LAALLFLYRNVLKLELQRIDDIERARLPVRLPVVLTKREVQTLLKELAGVHFIIAGLMYGAGLRLMECLRLRVKDIDFHYTRLRFAQAKAIKIAYQCCPVRSKNHCVSS
jgi:integrase